MSYIVAIIYLLGCSVFDFVWKRLPLWIVLTGSVTGIVVGLSQIYIFGQRDWIDVLFGLLPGVCVTGIALVSEDGIGLGDGVVLLIIGLILGMQMTIMAAVIGLLLSTLVGVALLIFKKVGLQTSIPFIPFLTIGVMVAGF